MAATANKERVGIIGVGRMGIAMVKHVINHGYQLTVCDISPDNVNKAEALGAKAAATPAELGTAVRFRHPGRRLRRRGQRGDAGPGWPVRNAAGGVDRRGLLDRGARYRQGAGPDHGRKRISACSTRRSAGAAGLPTRASFWPCSAAMTRWWRAAAQVYGTFCSDIAHLGDVGYRPGRQVDQQSPALDQFHRPDRGRPDRRVDRHRPASSCAMR